MNKYSDIQTTPKKIKIAYSGSQYRDSVSVLLDGQFDVVYNAGVESLYSYLFNQSLKTLPEAIILELGPDDTYGVIKKIRETPLLKHLVIILITDTITADIRKKALDLKVNDLYQAPFPMGDMCNRISFLVQFESLKPKLKELSSEVDVSYHVAFSKRFFDVFISLSVLILLSPLFFLIIFLIKLESKGPVIYVSKRVGTGYRIFNFYKFRSMRIDADVQLQSLSRMNQYADSENGPVSVFNKFVNDPRVTLVGRFLRNASLDELPQLINVLLGDMSLVGNRPLPLYEAELLTSNEWAMRFLGPAGLTGLWQVSRRGSETMSERERKKLDNYYAKNHSFWLDFKILVKTLPAMIQKEKV